MYQTVTAFSSKSHDLFACLYGQMTERGKEKEHDHGREMLLIDCEKKKTKQIMTVYSHITYPTPSTPDSHPPSPASNPRQQQVQNSAQYPYA